MAGEDFVQVQLSEVGVALAGEGGVIRVENSRSHFCFKAGEQLRVVRSYEWGYLRDLVDGNGRPLFEIAAPASTGAAAANPSSPSAGEVHEETH